MAVTICVLFLTVLMATVSNADVSLFGSAGSFGLNPVQGLSSDGPFRMQVPSFPPLPWPNNIQFPKFPKFPTFPPINTIKPLSFESIAAQGGQPGNNFNGIALISREETKKSKDGEVGRTGGATVLFNDNGKITVHQTGDAPPPISIIKDAPVSSL
ncbi:unnamed protein product [Arctia plantaginis]|uniref:Uncharacterized protein n=1 Tax=Arctia plantaginis TaxID=874455 RepID=A0A8S1A596_ARCPL|nr:unnamed protein product [Arctia plantaginis]